jgi:hypothetical protein
MKKGLKKQREFFKKIHSLADPEKKAGFIRFVHFGDGSERTFTTVVNSLSGDRLSWFDGNAPYVTKTDAWPKSVFRDIRAKATRVIECIGDF